MTQSIIKLMIFQLVGFMVFTVLEILVPKERMTIPERLRGLLFVAASVPVIAATALAYTAVADALNIAPIIRLRSPVASGAIAAILGALWADLIFYWFHRFQHRFLWRFHAVHHSIRNVSAINAYHHWTEPLFMTVVTGIPLMFIDVDFGPTLFLLASVFGYWSFYIHSPVRLHLGPLSRVIVDNRYHRVHHSLVPAHHDRNFGALTTLWDWAFGTLQLPAKGEWPAVGLDYAGEPRTLAEWESLPRRLRQGSVRAGGVKLVPPG